MKSIFNWIFGSFFRTIGRIFALIIVLFGLSYLLKYYNINISDYFLLNVKADTITPYSTLYGNNTGLSVEYFYYTNKYSFGRNRYYDGITYFEEGSLNVNNTGYGASALSVGFIENLTKDTYYDLTINFTGNYLRNSVLSNSIYLMSGNSVSSLSNSNVSLVGVVNSATNNSNTNVLTIRFNILNDSAYLYLLISNFANTSFTDYGFGISSFDLVEVDLNNTDLIIDNATNNTSNIINNNNNNTQDIINNNNSNTQNIIDNQSNLLGEKCSNLFDIVSMFKAVGINLPDTRVVNGVTITINTDGSISVNGTASANIQHYFFGGYNNNNEYNFTIPLNNNISYIGGGGASSWNTGAQFVMYDFTNNNRRQFNFYSNIVSMDKQGYKPTAFAIAIQSGTIINNTYKLFINEGTTKKSYCEYNSYSSKLDNTNNAINGLNNNINNDNVDSATSSAGNFFSNFTTNTHGLTSIITAPLTAIQSLTSSVCNPLVLPLPYVNKNLVLPCMRTIYDENFGLFMNLYDIISFGIISYWVLVRIFALVKDFKNPEHDEVEVMDL